MKYKLSFLVLLYLVTSVQANQGDINNSNKFWLFDEVVDIISEVVESPSEIARKLIKEAFPAPKPHGQVKVQTSIDLCAEEKKFIHNRMQKIQQVLQKEFGIDKPLKLGFCCSGGGNRAMIATLGMLKAAAQSRVLDASLYCAGLSGSTWLISPMCYLAATTRRHESFEEILDEIKQSYYKTLDDYSMLGVHGIYSPPLLSFESTDDLCIEVAKRFAYDQPITLVNMFGSLVGDYALYPMGNDRLSEKWTTMAHEVQEGNIPLPLCSAIFQTNSSNVNPEYEWFEMSPLQAGSSSLGYIPVQYLGSEFHTGNLLPETICHEYPISFYLGMYGSGFAATIQDIGSMQKAMRTPITILKEDFTKEILLKRNFLLNNSFVQGFIHDLIHDVISCRNSLTYAHFPNYSQGLITSSLYDSYDLGLFDAGIDFDLPLPLFVDRPERSLDIVILFDSHNGNSKALQDIADYCHRKDIDFPVVEHLNTYELGSHVMTVLNDPRLHNYNPKLTTYIYMPTNDINIYTPPYITFNFRYKNEDIDALSEKVEKDFLSKVDEIKEIMKLVAQKRLS